MTTYIKKIAMVPVTTIDEYVSNIDDEIEAIRDMADSLGDIAQAIDDHDEDAIMYGEIRELQVLKIEMEDTANNIRNLITGYVKELEGLTYE